MERYFENMKRQTRFYIEKAFYERIEQNREINVTTLCEQAGIGRRTFYRHFHSIDDVFEAYVRSLFEIYESSVSPLAAYDPEQIAREFFSFWDTKKRELRLLKQFDETKLSALLFRHGMKLVNSRSNGKFDWFPAYSAGGFLGMLDKWIEEDFVTPYDELTGQFAKETEFAFHRS